MISGVADTAKRAISEPDDRAAEESVRPLEGVRVLLVEDDDDSRHLLSLILQRYGAEVVSASSSAEALDAFMQKTPHVVISDIGMAEEDGYALLRKLRLLPVQGSLLPEGPSTSSAASLNAEPIAQTFHDSSYRPDGLRDQQRPRPRFVCRLSIAYR